MAKKRKKKKKHLFLSMIEIIATICVLGVVVMVAYSYFKDQAIEKVSGVVIQKVIENEASKHGVSAQKIEEVMQTIDESDKDIIEDIIAEHMSSDTIKEGLDVVEKGDENSVKEFIEEKLTEDEMESLLEIYEKYKDRF